MRSKLKLFALFLVISIISGLSGCIGKATIPSASSSSRLSSGLGSKVSSGSNSKVSSAPALVKTSATSFSLPVSLSKSLNPLTTDTMTNLTLGPLMFDCIAEPDASYSPVLGLASSIDNAGTTVTVHLRSGVKFSDGSILTAKDVKFSFELVKATPTSFFYSNVINIIDINPKDSSTVVFTLATPDTLFANLLTIPIVKNVPDINKTLIGSGRYIFSTDTMNGTLTANKNWYKGGSPVFQTIKLINIINSNAILSSLKVSEINYVFTDYGNGTVAAAGLDVKSVNLNRMVFLGVNSNKPTLSNAHVRRGISLAIDRKTIVSDIYSSRALACVLPFNPNWALLAKPADADILPNLSLASAEFTAAGYTTTNTNGALTSSANSITSLTLSLLVDKNNALMVTSSRKIATTLSKVGVIINIDAEASDVFNAKLASGDFDLYMGEIKLTDDMDLSPFLTTGGAASSGVSPLSSTLSAFNGWRLGTVKITDLAAAFTNETPFIPLCYKIGSVSFTAGLTGTITPTFSNIFLGIESWHF